MKKSLSFILTFLIIFASFPVDVLCSITRTATFTKTLIIPFSSSGTSQTQTISVDFDSDFENVEIIDSYVDNGNISSTSVNSSDIDITLRNGTYTNGAHTITKTNTLSLSDVTADSSGDITVTAEDNKGNSVAVNNITSVSGDFKSATFNGSTIHITPDSSSGVVKDDPELPLLTDTVTFSAPSDNTNQTYSPSNYSVLGTVVGGLTTVSSPYSGNFSVDFTSNSKSAIKATFSGGTPKTTKTITVTTKYNGGYFWVDRFLDKHFECMGETVVPWYQYRAENTSGKPGYIANGYAGDIVEYSVTMNKSDLGSVDFWGYYLGSAPSKGVVNGNLPSGMVSADSPLKKWYYTTTDLSNYGVSYSSNTRSMTANISSNKVSLSEKLQLNYADGGNFNAGPNKDIPAVEDQTTFFNTFKGVYETIVHHFKFKTAGNYGLYGGTIQNTYPYSAKVQYKYYQKNKFYDGTVTYTYDTIENLSGYSYNGWIKIRYTIDQTVTDNPPSRPGGILATPTAIINGASFDDYTPQNQLVYKYYYYKNNVWNFLGQTANGVTTYSWNPASLGLDLNNLKVGVRANDLYQDGEMGENDPSAQLDLTGTITPTSVPASESVLVTAQTDSSPDATAVSYNVGSYLNGNLDPGIKTPKGKSAFYHFGDDYFYEDDYPYEPAYAGLGINTVNKNQTKFGYSSHVSSKDGYDTAYVSDELGYYRSYIDDGTTVNENIKFLYNKYAPQIDEILGQTTFSNSTVIASNSDREEKVYVMGDNSYNQLQTGTIGNILTPTVFSQRLLTPISFGEGFSLFTQRASSKNQLYSIGKNNYSQLGNGLSSDSTSPVKVSSSDFSSYAAGLNYSIARDNTNDVWYAWGNNKYNKFGINEGSIPLPSTSLITDNFKKVAIGKRAALYLKTDGTVWSCGDNVFSQLGTGDTADRTSLTQIEGLSGVVDILCNEYASFALKSDGTVWAWGYDGNKGYLGLGSSITSINTPTKITTLSGITSIACNENTVYFAVKNDGTLYGWGSYLKLGVNSNTPKIISGISGVKQISVGTNHALALKTDGTVWVWGNNSYYELGDNTYTEKTVPTKNTYLSNIKQVCAYSHSSGAITNDGYYYYWGSGSTKIPTKHNYISNLKSVTFNYSNTYFTTNDNKVLSITGRNGASVTEYTGLSDCSAYPSFITKETGAFVGSGGRLYIYGDNYYNIFTDSGYSIITPIELTYKSGSKTLEFSEVGKVYTGENHIIIDGEDAVYVTGDNQYGQLGNGNNTNLSILTANSNLSGFYTFAVGANHTLALKSDGTVWSWGDNQYGQLGDGTNTNRNVPVQVSGLTNVIQISAGKNHSIALKSDGTVWAWGYNASGQLGNNQTTNKNTPVQVSGLTGIFYIKAFASHNMAYKNDDTVYLWGYNGFGQLGDGSTTNRTTPIKSSVKLNLNFSNPLNDAKPGNQFTLILPALTRQGANDDGYGLTDNSTAVSVKASNIYSNSDTITEPAQYVSGVAKDKIVTMKAIVHPYISFNSQDGINYVSIFEYPTYSNPDMLQSYAYSGSIGSAPDYMSCNTLYNESGNRDKMPVGKPLNTVVVPRWDLPVGIVIDKNKAKVYQDGALCGEVELKIRYVYREMSPYWYDYFAWTEPRTMEISPNIEFGELQHSNEYSKYNKYRFIEGTHMLSNFVWSADKINNMISGPMSNKSWLVKTEKETDITYNEVRIKGDDIPDYSPYLPTVVNWSKTITIPAIMKNGTYNMTLTTANGITKSIDLPFTVSTPINPDGIMPKQLYRNNTYSLTATSSKYVDDMELIIFGKNYSMHYDGLNASGNKTWSYNLTVPNTASQGKYINTAGPFRYAEFKATLPSGDTDSDYESFEIGIPLAINGHDITAFPGQEVQISAQTHGYSNSASLDILGNNVVLTNTLPTTNYDNIWNGIFTIPVNQALGDYEITYITTNSLSSANNAAILHVSDALNPIGDIPDSIETKTPWRAKCTTTVSASSVTVSIDPSPGAVQYPLHLVSNDGSKKYWESDQLIYPEMSAGGADGKKITGNFTAAAANGHTEMAIDTGHLWEKIELSGFELRRLLYNNDDLSHPVVETLSRSSSTESSNSVGFICAGWELGIKLITSGYVDKIEFDFSGPVTDNKEDISIKTLDNLTKRFEWDDVISRGRTSQYKDLSDLEEKFIFPQAFSKHTFTPTNYNNIFTTYYLVPYGTNQTLHSWYTLRQSSGSSLSIDKSQLLSRIKDPFILKLKLYSNDRFVEKEIKVDVFERWDTLLNRDIRPYVSNPGSHDPVDILIWESTDYVE